MKKICSKDNRIFKLCRQLSNKKYRSKLGLYLIEGENLIEEALKNGCEIENLLISENYKGNFKTPDEKVFLLDESLFSQLAQTETSQGIMAVVKTPRFSPDDFYNMEGGNFVILDRLQDPGNIGTIIRTADAAGYDLVIAMKGTADIFSPKVVRAATGSLFRMPVVFMDSDSELVEFTRAAGKKLVATCFDTDRYYFDEDLRKDIALVIGNEGNGISQNLIDSSELKIKIPMHGNIESLNASVAAAILMYESVRKNKMEG